MTETWQSEVVLSIEIPVTVKPLSLFIWTFWPLLGDVIFTPCALTGVFVPIVFVCANAKILLEIKLAETAAANNNNHI